MRRFITGLCCAIVGLQVLIGIPLAVGIALIANYGGKFGAPTSVEFRISRHADNPQTAAEDPRAEPELAADQDDAILEARHQRGSLMAGTLLGDNVSPNEERREFVAAFRQIAEEERVQLDSPLAPSNPLPEPATTGSTVRLRANLTGMDADRFAVEQLYAMAEQDEQARIYARADRWRTIAREIRAEIDLPIDGVATDCDECPRVAREE
jgi:hypothetical protein